MQQGVDPSRIAFTSFTRKAVQEARARVVERFGIKPSQLRYFRTLHSIAYHALGLHSTDVLSRAHYKELSEIIGRPLTASLPPDDEELDGEDVAPVVSKAGDQLLFLEALARCSCRPLRDVYEEQAPEDLSFPELERFSRVYVEYKRCANVLDFTDFLTAFLRDVPPLDIDVSIADEAQDFFTLQWQVHAHMSKRASRVIVAGDDDQAIYRWSGADVTQFLAYDGAPRVLGHSYRLPRAVYQQGTRILDNVKQRKPKAWEPRDEQGDVVHLLDEAHADLHDGGTWLLLARNAHLLGRLETVARDQGVTYTTRRRSSVVATEATAIRAWEQLRKGNAVSLVDAKLVYRYMRKRAKLEADVPYTMAMLKESHGLTVDGPWYEVLDGISDRQREYYRACLRRDVKLFEPPKVHINTIHGVKGGEADSVLVLSDMAWRSWQAYSTGDSDEEHRVFYVAATRARHKLYIVAGRSPYSYNWP